jgi:hypothetical protein
MSSSATVSLDSATAAAASPHPIPATTRTTTLTKSGKPRKKYKKRKPKMPKAVTGTGTDNNNAITTTTKPKPPKDKGITKQPKKRALSPSRPYWVYPPIDPAYIKIADAATTRAFVESHHYCIQYANSLLEQFGSTDMEICPHGDVMGEELARTLRPVKLRRLENVDSKHKASLMTPLPIFAGDE